MSSVFYTKKTFRKLTDEQVGVIQHRIFDKNEKAAVLADEYGVSLSPIYYAKNCVPEDLIHFDDISMWKFRNPPKKRKKTAKRAAM